VNAFLSQQVPLSWYLLLSAVLFSLGIVGFLIKRNLITVFMSIELMLNAVNLSFVTFARQFCDPSTQGCLLAQAHAVKGQIFVFFVMMVAAAEAAVGLAIIIAVFRARATLAVDRIDLMKL
jgi:NADH-quinone oxidoreductase subunit K